MNDQNLCKHKLIFCENCGQNMDELCIFIKDQGVGNNELLKEKDKNISELHQRLENIKSLCDYLHGFHPPTCNGWAIFNHKIIFQGYDCDCFISDIIHEINMTEV